MKYNKGHEFEYKTLRPSQIRCDELYQRPLDPRRVDRIAKAFNGDIFNEPKVSYRNGVFWVFDGQHSIAVWKKLNDGEDKPLLCKVFKGMTWLEEEEAFVLQNGIAKDPTTNEKLRAAFNARNPDVVSMVNGAQLAGYLVDFNPYQATNRIIATSTLFKAHQTLGYDWYLDMLTAIREAWGSDSDAISGPILTGMTTFYKTYAGYFNRDDLVKSLRKVKPSEIIRNGRAYTTKKNNYSREILRAYNAKRSRRRLEDQL